MKVSWRLLSQILDLTSTNPAKLAETLTSTGFEVDNIPEIKVSNIEDVVYDIISIPNRADLLSIIGIAREVAIILHQTLDFKFLNLSFWYNKKRHSEIRYHKVVGYSHCLIILMSHLGFYNSPKWIQDYLILANIKPVNGIIDIKNYIKLKWGQSLEVLDISKLYLHGQKNIINIKSCTKDHLVHGLASHTMLSVDLNNVPVTACNTNVVNMSTHTILIQATISNSLGQCTFPSPENCENDILYLAVQESIFLYKKFCGGFIIDFQDLNLRQDRLVSIKIVKSNLIRILGPIIDKQQFRSFYKTQVTQILTLLNLNPVEYSKYWLVTIPRYRLQDLKREIDVIEEIARIYGFHYFSDVIPYVHIKNKISLRELLKRQIRLFLGNIGLFELIHSSFQREQSVSVLNPLSDEYDGLRSNLVVKLVEALCYNLRHGNDEFDGFEIGKVFFRQYEDNIISEKLCLGIILGCKGYLRPAWSDKPDTISWFQAKGIISNLCQSIGITLFWHKPTDNFGLEQIVHSRRTAVLYSKQRRIGFFGEINPRLCYRIGIKKKFYVCELDLDMILNQLENYYPMDYRVQSYSKYPYIVRDISMIVPKELVTSFIISQVCSINNSFIKSIELFDEYSGEPIPVNKKSLSMRVKYQSSCGTLTNAQVDQLDSDIRNIIRCKLNIEIR